MEAESMRKQTLVRKIMRVLVGGLAATTLATSCSTAELDLVRQGLDVLIQTAQDDNDDISFGDWLAQELRD
jgi:hypothetical protein